MKPITLKPGLDLDDAMEDAIHRVLRRAWGYGFVSGIEVEKAVAKGEPTPPHLINQIRACLADIEEDDE